MAGPELRTPRLVLRRWRASDREPWVAMGQDAQVMEFFPSLLTAERSAAAIARIEAHFEREGFGFWAVEVVAGAPFIGFCGIGRPGFTAAFTPCVEVGWRIARDHWGQGYATEAARAALAHGFEVIGLPEIVAFLVAANARSARVAERLGMVRDPAGDFDHPQIVPGASSVGGHEITRHILYRIGRTNWGAMPR